jgi:predicted PurR-regulated permease PerM
MKNNLLLKIEKWAIWIALIGVIVLLRHLLPVIFLTFVLTYIGSTLIRLLGRWIRWRRVNVGIVFALFLLILTGVGVIVVPRVFSEARDLAVDYISQEPQEADLAAAPVVAGRVVFPDEEPTLLDRQTKKYIDSILIQVVGRETFESYRRSGAYQSLINKTEESLRAFIPKVVAGVRDFANASLSVVLQFFLSIILSFLILWDLPALKRGIKSLSTGRTADIYAEIAPGMTAFGVILGRAFEAQTGIAVVNAILTSIGFIILGIPSIALLATIVFFCSYIPVVGVFLSTLPAALLAFKTGGIALVFWLVVMVLVVHAVEAYALNPMIYGRHLKMHPVMILAILLVGEHLFGIWGLLLGVPITAFIRHYVLGASTSPPESAVAVPIAPAAAAAE